jgi:uncharacterized metal-binding protein YceD (DUF177 family)
MENWPITKTKGGGVIPELSRPIAVTEIQGDCLLRKVVANKEECTKLAQRFDLIELKSFCAEVKLTCLNSQSIILVEGTLNAKIVQQCVVTLEPVVSDISCKLNCKYSESQKLINAESVDFDAMAEDPPELIVDGQFDIGSLLTEYLGVELDPFPRSLEANINTTLDKIHVNKIASNSSNPFDVLRKLK